MLAPGSWLRLWLSHRRLKTNTAIGNISIRHIWDNNHWKTDEGMILVTDRSYFSVVAQSGYQTHSTTRLSAVVWALNMCSILYNSEPFYQKQQGI